MSTRDLLAELNQPAISRLELSFTAGQRDADVGEYVEAFGREVQLGPVRDVLDEAFRRFSSGDRARSDRWLGPRLHAALRLSRREASRRGVWRFLGVLAADDYVRWRFRGDREDPDAPPKLERFVGPDYKHALARLWWMAELFRDGPDYLPAVKALSNQDVVNNLFRMEIAHHRPTALGAVRVLSPEEGDNNRSGREANALAKAVNATAATVLLDAYAPDLPLDEDARARWIEEAPSYDPLRYLEELPLGPDDPPAPEASVDRMEALLEILLGEAPVRGRASAADPDELATAVVG